MGCDNSQARTRLVQAAHNSASRLLKGLENGRLWAMEGMTAATIPTWAVVYFLVLNPGDCPCCH